MTSTQRRRQRHNGRPRPHHWLLVLPFVWQVALVPVVNDVSSAPFNIPFPMVWQMAGVLVTSAVIAVVFLLGERAGAAAEEADFIAATEGTADAERHGGDRS
ncbi:DUF3311 domain-containing protein [Streptomyces sp. NPDC050759]|uniref:DUF3311 domain-containing protein n=1 Tax=Streptomyces sp. NPDC050759 TaxID=3365635 RepID=UPI0037BD72E9